MCLVVVVVARFERPPDKRFETEAVQPSQYSQTTLNKTLGVRSKDVAGARVRTTACMYMYCSFVERRTTQHDTPFLPPPSSIDIV